MTRARAAAGAFTAMDVARFCGVDLKTVHNWAAKGKIAHDRTEGRHLRFRRVELIDFLRRYGYPLPAAIRDGRPRVVLVDADASTSAAARRAIARRFDVRAYARAVEGLVALGAADADALVLDLAAPSIDPIPCIVELRATEATRHLRVVAWSADEVDRDAALAAGASALVRKAQPARLREVLEELTGVA